MLSWCREHESKGRVKLHLCAFKHSGNGATAKNDQSIDDRYEFFGFFRHHHDGHPLLDQLM